jgi:hypothetical protein
MYLRRGNDIGESSGIYGNGVDIVDGIVCEHHGGTSCNVAWWVYHGGGVCDDRGELNDENRIDWWAANMRVNQRRGASALWRVAPGTHKR